MDRVSKAERELIRKIMKKTNYEMVREMSPNELADFIADTIDCCNCKHPRNGCTDSVENCARSWFEWLQEIAKQ